jgi:hypothetical protein
MATYAIITFHTTHFAIKAKKVLARSGKRFEMIPVPREFSSDCGFCCKVSWEEKEKIENILGENRIEIDSVFRSDEDEEREGKKKFRFV